MILVHLPLTEDSFPRPEVQSLTLLLGPMLILMLMMQIRFAATAAADDDG